jgi:uncharacterized protein (DUF697 family)
MLRHAGRLFGTARYFWEALREINPADVRADLERSLTLAIVGSPGSGRHSLARALFGTDSGPGIVIADVHSQGGAADPRPDLAFVVLNAAQADWAAERRVAHEISGRGVPLILILTHADRLHAADQGRQAVAAHFPDYPPELVAVVDPRDAYGTRRALAPPIVQTVRHLRLALGHRFVGLRDAVAEDLIREISRTNAQFALVSSLPAMVPLVGGLVGGAADLFVLTKNQALLVFKLAGIYGRDLDDKMGIIREILPVVGGGFVWRTLARSAVGLFPPMVSALPKVTVAYVGTYVVGAAAKLYYERGRRPTPIEMREISRGALAAAPDQTPTPVR